MKKLACSFILVLVCLSAACGPTLGLKITDPAAGPSAWIDAPLNYSSLPLAEYDVVSHASDPGGIAAFELSVDGKVVATAPVPGDQAGATLAHVQQPWQPAAPGVYLLSVRARDTQGNFGPYAYAHVTVGQVTATPTVTPTVTPSATITPTATSSAPTATGLKNTNCHFGPGNIYKVDGTLFKGQSVPIEGIDAGRTWVWVKHPNLAGLHCWLSIPIVQVTGSLDGLPIIPAPPLPATATPPPTPTATRSRLVP